jgi:hypothetical protein
VNQPHLTPASHFFTNAVSVWCEKPINHEQKQQGSSSIHASLGTMPFFEQ